MTLKYQIERFGKYNSRTKLAQITDINSIKIFSIICSKIKIKSESAKLKEIVIITVYLPNVTL